METKLSHAESRPRESSDQGLESYAVSNRVMLAATRDEVWRHITSPEAMTKWMSGVSEARMEDPGHADGGSVGARIELEGRIGKLGSWVCVGETVEAGKNHLVRLFRVEKLTAASLFVPTTGPDGRAEYPYVREVTHRLNAVDATRTELTTDVLITVPGMSKSTLKAVTRADKKALEVSHRRLERRLSGRRSPFAFLSSSWHTVCFL